MTAVEQVVFLRDHLGPALKSAGLKTKVFVFDHNWDLIEYPNAVLSDAKAAAFAAGTAPTVTAASRPHRMNCTIDFQKKKSG